MLDPQPWAPFLGWRMDFCGLDLLTCKAWTGARAHPAYLEQETVPLWASLALQSPQVRLKLDPHWSQCPPLLCFSLTATPLRTLLTWSPGCLLDLVPSGKSQDLEEINTRQILAEMSPYWVPR